MAINKAATSVYQQQRYHEESNRAFQSPSRDGVNDAGYCALPLQRNAETVQHRSAVRLLRQMKPLYMKSESALDADGQAWRTNLRAYFPSQLLPTLPPSTSHLFSHSPSKRPDCQLDKSIGACNISLHHNAIMAIQVDQTNTKPASSCAVAIADSSENKDKDDILPVRQPCGSGNQFSEDHWACGQEVPTAPNSTLTLIPPPLKLYTASTRLANITDECNSSTGIPFAVPKSTRFIQPPPGFRKSACSSRLQNKLRKLLNADSEEYVLSEDTNVNTVAVKANSHEIKNDYQEDETQEKIDQNDAEEASLAGYCGNSLPPSPTISCFSYVTPPPLYCDDNDWQLTSKRHLLSIARSKSDVGESCHQIEANVAVEEVQSTTDVVTVAIGPIDASNLNSFFDNLGLDSEEFGSIIAANVSSPTYSESGSSSSPIESVGGYTSDEDNATHKSGTTSESLSIVERNARIIKWLCNCRKAFEPLRRFTPAPQPL